ncbi:MAG: hypothetical protein M1371_01130 [Actinobacteria bacterium]|nr:hypothetical protein [Actinomycetota bacterium]
MFQLLGKIPLPDEVIERDETRSAIRNNDKYLLDREFSKLVKSAMIVEVPQVDDEMIYFIAGHVPVEKEAVGGLILYMVGMLSACLTLLAVVGILIADLRPVFRVFAMFVPAMNLLISPLAALAVIRRRLFNV